MKLKEKFPGIFSIDNKLATLNHIKEFRPFSEQLIEIKNKEYRFWDPNRSKLGAAVMKGIKIIPLKKGMKILYLGLAHCYTATFISNIIGEQGIIYGIEFSERCFNESLPIAEKYKNIVPILADVRKPEIYNWIEKVDILYCDVADPQEVEIFIRNCKKFLKPKGYGLIAIKSRSIDVTKAPKQIYKESIEKLKESGFEIIDWKTLDPFEEAHAMVIVRI